MDAVTAWHGPVRRPLDACDTCARCDKGTAREVRFLSHRDARGRWTVWVYDMLVLRPEEVCGTALAHPFIKPNYIFVLILETIGTACFFLNKTNQVRQVSKADVTSLFLRCP